MNQADYDHFCALLKTRSGIDLGPDKAYLLQSRLAVVAQSGGFADVPALLAGLRRAPSGVLVEAVVDAMTTNETFFFRDSTPFDQFRQAVLPKLYEARNGMPLRIWCGACSTGQEPYSLAMILEEEKAKYPRLRADIVGTDLSDRCLAKAKTGIYSQFEVQRGLPVQMLVKYFDKLDATFQVKPFLRQQVSWRKLNLLDSFRAMGRFDVVFLRNVLIYFDRPTKTQVLEAVTSVMADDGALFLGAAETVLGITDRLRASATHRGLYNKSTLATAAA